MVYVCCTVCGQVSPSDEIGRFLMSAIRGNRTADSWSVDDVRVLLNSASEGLTTDDISSMDDQVFLQS